jgi:hypothetical protein
MLAIEFIHNDTGTPKNPFLYTILVNVSYRIHS